MLTQLALSSRLLTSINAVGVDIAAFSAMSDEEEVLLLPGLPMVNRVGGNPEPDLWTFDVETPGSTVSDGSGQLPRPLIDYVHPGEYVAVRVLIARACQLSS